MLHSLQETKCDALLLLLLVQHHAPELIQRKKYYYESVLIYGKMLYILCYDVMYL